MKQEVLQKINQSINHRVKEKVKKSLITDVLFFKQFSLNLKELVLSNEEIKNIFPKNQELLYYSGDILVNTFFKAWRLKSEDFSSFFDEEVYNVLNCQIRQPALTAKATP